MPIKISMKRTCSGCMAAPTEGTYCLYGYRIEPKRTKQLPGFSAPTVVEYAPTEPCPKPRTYKAFHDIQIEDSRADDPQLPIYRRYF